MTRAPECSDLHAPDNFIMVLTGAARYRLRDPDAALIADAPALLAQRDQLAEALRAIVALLDQPVQHSTTPDTLPDAQAVCELLRGDAKVARIVARTVLAALDAECEP